MAFLAAFVFAGLLVDTLTGAASIDQISSSPNTQPNIVIVPCNGTETIHHQPVYNIENQQQNKHQDYFVPTILNQHALAQNQNDEDEDHLDNGNRIQSPHSWVSNKNKYPNVNRPTFTLPHPQRLSHHQQPSSQNSVVDNNLADKVQIATDIENGVKFYLFTRQNTVVSQELKPYLIKHVNKSNFIASHETKLIFHGFTDVDAPGEWVNALKEAYLVEEDANVVVADFSSLPLTSLLRTSVPAFCAKKVADFVSSLLAETRGPLSSFHLIARSYACHLAGLSGRMLGGQLGRITCLEPTPKIAGVVGRPDIKLSESDARFVEVTHVNGQRFFFHGSQFGLAPAMGHVDIYPNILEKGLGCPSENMNFGRHNVKFCHLGRGVRYFTKSIRYKRLYPMCHCPSFNSYKSGLCSCSRSESREFLGAISNTTRGVFQLAPTVMPSPYSPLLDYRFLLGY